MNNIIKLIPELRNKNKKIKNLAKDLLSNIKLLCFVNKNNIIPFFQKMKDKYEDDFQNFFKKFEKIYIKSNPYNELYWNYNSAIINNSNNDIMFFTNNFCERYNRTLNLKFISGCKSIYNFERSLKEFITLYNNMPLYQEGNISITRSLQYYAQNNNIIDLIMQFSFERNKM